MSEQRLAVGLSANVLAGRPGLAELDGIGIYTRSLAGYLPAQGVDVVPTYAPDLRGGFGPSSRPPGGLAFAQPIPSAIVASVLLGMPMAGARAVQAAVRVYHATDYLVPPLRGTPVVATVYDAIAQRCPHWATPRLRRLKNWIRRRGLQRADVVLTLTHSTVPEIEEYFGIPRSRIKVVPPGVDRFWFESPEPEQIRQTLERWGLQPGFLLFVGTLQPRKNVRGLLAAYDCLPAPTRAERPLVIAGRYGWGDAPLLDELKQRAAGNRCRWLEYVDQSTLRVLYATAGVLVFPSLAEGFGLPVLEALAAGLPVVASALPQLREVGGAAVCYADVGSREAFAEAIERVLRGCAPLRVAEGRQRASAFTWEAAAAATAAIYRALA
ncbi:MAG: glycosyltransferase family 1 protein [Casimicrobiaceae bacterium]